MIAKSRFFCAYTVVVLIVYGSASSQEYEGDLRGKLRETRQDVKQLMDFVELMKRRIPRSIETLIHDDPSVIRLKEILKQSGNEQCNLLFREKMQTFTNDISAATLKSIVDETSEFRIMLLEIRKQLLSGPALGLENKSDDLSKGEYSDILQLVTKNLNYEEDSVKTMESSFVEDAKEKLHKELEQREIFNEVEYCLYA